MMHGLEKSDPAIVATKPANNVGKPAAEWVEPRAGTKGNTDQPHTCRAQMSVSTKVDGPMSKINDGRSAKRL